MILNFRLKLLASELDKSEDKRKNKEMILNNLRQDCERLQQAVKNYEAKLKIENRIKLLNLRKEWWNVSNTRKKCVDQQKTRDEAQRRVTDVEKSLQPLKDQVAQLMREQNELEARIKRLNLAGKQLTETAHSKAVRIEKIVEAVDELNDKFEHIIEDENRKKEHLETLEKELAALKAQYQEAEDTR